jgi:hypothetical protein
MGVNSQQPRRPSRLLVVLLTASGLLAGALAGGVSGAVAGLSWAQPAGPTAPPTPATNFPNSDQRFLPNVTMAYAAERWLKDGNRYTCTAEDFDRPADDAPHRMRCQPPGDLGFDLNVLLEYDDDTHVRKVTANCELPPGAAACKTLFASTAYALFHTDPRLREQGRGWAAKNVDTDNATTIGGVRLQVSLEPHSIVGLPAG